MTTRQEVPLLSRLQARERRACEAFVDAHYRDVYRFFLWLTNDGDAAADLTQETFTAFWAELRPDRAIEDLRTWLFAIARNRWRKRCRSRGRQQDWECAEEELELPCRDPGPEARFFQALEAETVAAAVHRLPLELREALVLRIFHEWEYAEIAGALGVTEGLIRWRVHRARQRLRQYLDPGLGLEAGNGPAQDRCEEASSASCG